MMMANVTIIVDGDYDNDDKDGYVDFSECCAKLHSRSHLRV